MSGIFRNIDPPATHPLASVQPPADTLAGWRGDGGGGGSIVRKTPDTALYSIHVRLCALSLCGSCNVRRHLWIHIPYYIDPVEQVNRIYVGLPGKGGNQLSARHKYGGIFREQQIFARMPRIAPKLQSSRGKDDPSRSDDPTTFNPRAQIYKKAVRVTKS